MCSGSAWKSLPQKHPSKNFLFDSPAIPINTIKNGILNNLWVFTWWRTSSQNHVIFKPRILFTPIPLQKNKQLQVVCAYSICPPSLSQSIYYLMSLPFTKENAFQQQGNFVIIKAQLERKTTYKVWIFFGLTPKCGSSYRGRLCCPHRSFWPNLQTIHWYLWFFSPIVVNLLTYLNILSQCIVQATNTTQCNHYHHSDH